METTTATPASTEVSSEQLSFTRRFVAGLLSAALPGLGQAFVKQAVLGIVFLVLLLALHFGSAQFRVFADPMLQGGVAIFGFLLTFGAAATALLARPRPAESRLKLGVGLVVLFAVATLAAATLGSFPMRMSGFSVYTIPNSAMEPTIQQNEAIIADERWYQSAPPQRGDVVVTWMADGYAIRRVIGLPGETIESRDGHILVNGKEISEAYVQLIGGASAPAHLRTFGPFTIPDDRLFLLGDNRDSAFDSRTPEFGLRRVSDLKGKVLYISVARDWGRSGQPVN